MSDVNHENLGERGKQNIAKETREAIKPIVKTLTEKFNKMGFKKEDFGPAIKEGIDSSKGDV